MAKTITEKVVFKNTTAKVLYDMYMNEKRHSEVTGGTAKIIAKEGTSYSVFDESITGKNLQLIKDTLIVQTWRGSDWDKNESDSIFIIKLEPKGKDVALKMIHANIPSKHVDGIKKGWNDYYWEPWKKYLEAKK